ncbi:MAG: mechanosensitive ion channel [Candidatus Woesearchaeota archaeon]|nr:mechanosensitive ion channel [Candidatus Woesearchaeota archaeon]
MDLVLMLHSVESFFTQIEYYVNTLVVMLVILLAGFIVGRIVDRLVRKIFLRLELDNVVTKLIGFRRNYARATKTTIVNLIYIVTILLALRQIHADRIVVAFVLGLFLFIICVSVLLTGIEAIPNILAWLKLRKRISVGDRITVADPTGNIKGTVTKLMPTDTHVQLSKGDVVFLPNNELLHTHVTKRSRS